MQQVGLVTGINIKDIVDQLIALQGKPRDAATARQALVGELADLWFHSMVAMAHLGLGPHDVVAELARREGLSGLEEFARRSAPGNKPVV